MQIVIRQLRMVKIFPDFGGCEDTGARIRQQPSWLLQQSAVRDRW